EPQTNYFSVIQPLIHPLFKTRQFEASLLKLTGNPNDYEAYFRNYWINKLGDITNFEKFLQDGVIESGALKSQTTFVNVSDLTSASAGETSTAIGSDSSSKASDSTLQKATPIVLQ